MPLGAIGDAGLTTDTDASPTQTTATTSGRKQEPQRCLESGTHVGRYVILEPLGQGGMGVVYKAYDPQLDRGVALKLMRASSTADASTGEVSARLQREGQALAQLAHPNVVAVHDVGTFEDEVFVAMELVEGPTFKRWMSSENPDPDRVLSALIDAGRGLAAAHAAGMVHRDVKPDNIVIGSDGRVRVIDFGLARAETPSEFIAGQDQEGSTESGLATPNEQQGSAAEELPSPGEDEESNEATSRSLLGAQLTMHGSVMGTPAYMAPEHYLGREVDARSDQFSFCVTMYEAFFGCRPFPGAAAGGLRRKGLGREAQPPPADTDVPKWRQRVVLRGLSVDPADRYPSMDVLLLELSVDPDAARRIRRAVVRRRLVLTAVLLVSIGGSAALWYQRDVEQHRVCDGAAEKLTGVWDAATKHSIRQAFQRSGVSYADDAWQRVRQRLDAHARQWVAEHVSACEATALRHEQSAEMLDLRMICLARRLGELKALAGVLSTADAGVVGKSVKAAHDLPPIGQCGDLQALAARTKPPKDAATRARVEALRVLLAQAAALEKTGQYQDALAIVERVRPEALALDYPLIHAEALVAHGLLLQRVGEFDEAETALRLAARAAATAGQPALVTRTLARLMFVVAYEQGRYADSFDLKLAAELTLSLGGNDKEAEAELMSNLGAAYWSQGDYDQAVRHFERVLELSAELYDQSSPSIGSAFNNMGTVLLFKGEYDRALASYHKARSIYVETLGLHHPESFNPLFGIAEVYKATGAYDLAERTYLEVIEGWTPTLGADHPSVAGPLEGLCSLAFLRGRWEQSRAFCERALAICGDKSCVPVRVAGASFVMARLLCQGQVVCPSRRARALAQTALAVYANIRGNERAVADVQQWLDSTQARR